MNLSSQGEGQTVHPFMEEGKGDEGWCGKEEKHVAVVLWSSRGDGGIMLGLRNHFERTCSMHTTSWDFLLCMHRHSPSLSSYVFSFASSTSLGKHSPASLTKWPHTGTAQRWYPLASWQHTVLPKLGGNGSATFLPSCMAPTAFGVEGGVEDNTRLRSETRVSPASHMLDVLP